jgi:hypothetical protein
MLKVKIMILDGSPGLGTRTDVTHSLRGKSCTVVTPPHMVAEWVRLLPNAAVVTPQMFVKRWGALCADVLVVDIFKPLKKLSEVLLSESRRFDQVIGLL